MEELLKHLERLENRQEEMLATITRLCDINSGTLNLPGVERVSQELVKLFEPLGGDLQLIDTAPWSVVGDGGKRTDQALGKIIHIIKHPEASGKVMLCIHCDTVYGIGDSFQKCRMTAGGQLNGPGVADAKGGLIVMLEALKTLESSPLAGQIGWEVIINPDEEIGSPGSGSFLRSRAGECDFGMLFEPALPGGGLVSWRKGTGNFTFVVRGQSAHSGRDFAAGRNAIVALARLLDEIDQLNIEPDVTYNVGRITGGGAVNIVPDLAVGRVNVRVVNLEQQSGVEIDFADLVEKYNQLDGISVEISGGFTSPPKPLEDNVKPLQHRITRCAQILDIDIDWQGTGGACDGNKFASAGLPNIDTLGPCGGHIHSSNEFLIPGSLIPRTKLASLILLAYASEIDNSGGA